VRHQTQPGNDQLVRTNQDHAHSVNQEHNVPGQRHQQAKLPVRQRITTYAVPIKKKGSLSGPADFGRN